jgi:hypothetical protein
VLEGSRGFCFLGFFERLRVRLFVCSRIDRVRTWFLLLIHNTSLTSSSLLPPRFLSLVPSLQHISDQYTPPRLPKAFARSVNTFVHLVSRSRLPTRYPRGSFSSPLRRELRSISTAVACRSSSLYPPKDCRTRSRAISQTGPSGPICAQEWTD